MSHVIGEQAVSIFLSACPPEWIKMPIQPDYGLDLRIEIAKENKVTGEEFFVQVKGRKNVKRIIWGRIIWGQTLIIIIKLG